MKNTFKQRFAFVLALTMLLSALPTTAFAANADQMTVEGQTTVSTSAPAESDEPTASDEEGEPEAEGDGEELTSKKEGAETLAAEEEPIAYTPWNQPIYASTKIFGQDAHTNALPISKSFAEAVKSVLEEMKTTDDNIDVPSNAADLTVGQMQQITGKLDLSDKNITELPAARKSSVCCALWEGMKNITEIDFSGNTFTVVPYDFFGTNKGPDQEAAPEIPITKITWPDTVEVFADQSMDNMVNLVEMNIPTRLKVVKSGALSGCSNLQLDLSDFPEGINFGSKSMRDVQLTGNFDTIQEEKKFTFYKTTYANDAALNQDDNAEFVFENTQVTATAEYLMENYSELVLDSTFGALPGVTGNLVLPQDAKAYNYCFDQWGITSAEIPSSVTLGTGCFSNNDNLKEITVKYNGVNNLDLSGSNIAASVDVTYDMATPSEGNTAEQNGAALVAAIEKAPAGAVINVPAGTYKLPSNTYASPEGNGELAYGLMIDKDITLKGDGTGKTIITSDVGGYSSGMILFTEYDVDVTIDGFTFNSGAWDTIGCDDPGVKNVTITNCEFNSTGTDSTPIKLKLLEGEISNNKFSGSACGYGVRIIDLKENSNTWEDDSKPSDLTVDIAITGNDFSELALNNHADRGVIHITTGDPGTVRISENKLNVTGTGFAVKDHNSTASIEAPGNYWGADLAISDIVEKISGNVSIDNYYTKMDENGNMSGLVEVGGIPVATEDQLKTAIENAADGATIVLVKDITIDEALDVKANITIKGNDKTITANSCPVFYIKDDLDALDIHDLTLKGNMTIDQAGETMNGEPYMAIGTYTGYYGVADLELTDVTIDGFTYGLYFGSNTTNKNPVKIQANNLIVQNCYVKGAYFEKLTDSNFVDCQFLNNGDTVEDVANADFLRNWMCGVDINLKYGDYQNISFENCDFSGNGANNGTALHVKARGTGNDSSYAAAPASLSGVDVSGCTFHNNNEKVAAPIVIGEPDKNNTTPVNISIQPDVNYISNLQKNSVFAVTFNSNGGDAVATMLVANGTEITLPAAGNKEGYEFEGWYSDATEQTYKAGEKVTITADTAFTAVWDRISSGGASHPSAGDSSSSSGSSGNKTETTENSDGSTTTTTTSSNGTVTETTKYEDGSKEVIKTDKDGNVTTTYTDADGNKTETVEKEDGSVTTTIDNKDGSSSTTTVDEDGKVAAEVTLSDETIANAIQNGEAVKLPMPKVEATTIRADAPTVTVKLASSAAKVEIPVDDVTAGTVAVLVKADGTEEVIKTTVTTEDGVLVTLNDGDTVKIVDNSKTFADVATGYWGNEGIDFASSRELFTGTSETTFSPEQNMSRAMIWTVLARLDGADTTQTGSIWYQAGSDWAIASGISDGSNPNGAMTREQLVTMLYRYAGSPAGSAALTGYTDLSDVSDYAADAMDWAVDTGLVTGMGDDTLNPQGTAVRAQVATILMRFCENIAK